MKFLPAKAAVKGFAKYLLLGAAVFAVGLVWNFPYERIRDTLTRTLTRNTGYRFEMDRLSPALPVGFRAEGARISGPPLGGMPVDFQVKLLKVKVSPPALLLYPFRKSISLSFTADQGKTRWWGGLGFGRSDAWLRLKTEDLRFDGAIPLGEIDPAWAGSAVKLKSKIGLALDLAGGTEPLLRGDLTDAGGNLTLNAAQVSVTPPLLKEVRFDRITVSAALEKAKLDVKSIQLSGPDISGTGSGSIRVDPFFPRSQLNLDAKILVSDKAQDLRALVSTLGPSNGIQMNADGLIVLKIAGPLSPISELSARSY